MTAKTGIAKLRGKLADYEFSHDLDAFTATLPGGYDLDRAAEMIINDVLSKLWTRHNR